LDYRAHDFRLDVDDPSGLTVRLTSRTVGTLRGELRLRSETVLPNGKRMVCPPESISMTFDAKSGKLVKLCSGFAMDRLVGNTGGLCGVMAAATVAGSPPSEWEVYPPSVVVGRFFRRSVQQLVEPDQFFLAPFPESVMIQLAKGVLAAENGVKDPDLLSGDFTFCGPTVGPLNKIEFIEEFGGEVQEVKSAFPDLEENYSNFRVDPYDPYRVWYDVKSTGTRTGMLNGKEPDGKRFIGPPEAASMTFDDDGFCTRMTGGAVMDPTDCNTGGLGGTSGILYAAGAAPSPIAVRPLPQILSRLQKGLLSPLTGQDVDDFATVDVDETKARPIPVATTPPLPPTPPQAQPQPPIVEKEEIEPEVTLPTPPPVPPQMETKTTPVPAPKVSTPPTLSLLKPPKISLPEIKAPQTPAPAEETISDEPSDPVTEVFSSFFSPAAKSAPSSPKETSNDKSTAEEAKLARKKEAEEKRAKALAAADEKRRLAEEKKDALKKAEKVLSQAKPRATISLGFFGFGQKPDAKKEEQQQGGGTPKAAVPAAGAPRGVPTIKDWRQKSDGSITGLIYGSRMFGAGESITTSPIQGKAAENAVVQTKTGSKYYLGTKSVVGRKGLFGFGGGGGAGAKKAVSPAQANKKTVVIKKNTSKEDALAKRKAELEAQNRAKAEAAAKRKAELEAARLANAEEAARKREELAAAAARKKEEAEAAKQAKAEAAASQKEQAEATKKAQAAARKKEEAAAAKQAKAEAAARKKEEAEAAKQAKAEAAARKKEEAEAAKKAKVEAAEAARQAKAEAAAQKKEELEAAKRVKAEALAKKKQELAKKSNAKSTLQQKKSGTISLGASSESSSPGLFSFGKGEKKPPAGVPVISRWKKNPDGSITGMISGSKAFKEGEKVTTSKLAPGQTVAAGSLVVTASGSKYFLK